MEEQDELRKVPTTILDHTPKIDYDKLGEELQSLANEKKMLKELDSTGLKNTGIKLVTEIEDYDGKIQNLMERSEKLESEWKSDKKKKAKIWEEIKKLREIYPSNLFYNYNYKETMPEDVYKKYKSLLKEYQEYDKKSTASQIAGGQGWKEVKRKANRDIKYLKRDRKRRKDRLDKILKIK